MNFTAATFYTNDYYKNQTEILNQSCKKYDIPLIITEVEDRGSWVKNCAFKAYYIYDLLQSINKDVLWLDSDAQILQHPFLFDTFKEDFGIRAEPGQNIKKPVGREKIFLPSNWPNNLTPRWFNSGTIYFKNNDKTKELCRRWLQLCTKNETDWDQWTLQQAWCDVQPITNWLPVEYCQIKKIHGDKGAIILHDLASVAQKVNRE